MKLAGREAQAFCRKPDPAVAGILLHGPDAGLISLCRRDLVARLSDDDDMRVTRIDGQAARKDTALIDEAVRARGFFPGRRVVHVEGARDFLAAQIKDLTADIDPDDAVLVLEADQLSAKSALRKVFDGDRRLVSAGLYPEPPGRADVERMLSDAGLNAGAEPDALDALAALAREIDEGAFRQFAGTVATFGLDRSEAIALAEVEALMPGRGEAELDQLVDAVAEGRVGEIAPLLLRLTMSGTTPAGILIATGRHFRRLFAVASAKGGTDQALNRLRPPVFGPRRNAFQRQVGQWGGVKLERAVRLIFDADRTLRSPGQRPDHAMVERALIRIAMMVARQAP